MTTATLPPEQKTLPSRPVATKTGRGRLRASLVGYAFIAPLLLGLGVFHLYPMLVTTYASFTDWDGLSPMHWVGFDNYVQLITRDPLFLQVVGNTLFFMIGAIPLTMVLATLLATLVGKQRPGITAYRLALFIPYVANSVAVSVVWFRLFSGRDGVLNTILSYIGIPGPDWLASSPWAMIAVIIASVWQGLGYPMIVLIAGIQSIPESLHEAAQLDGAGPIRRWWSITLPLLTPSLFFVSISQFVASFQVFGIVYVMTKGGPGHDTDVYMTRLFAVAFRNGELGTASAMAWLMFLVVAALTVFQWQAQKKWVHYE